MGKMFRVTRGMKYGALFLAGVITLISPLVIVTEGGGLIISMIWSCFILVGSALSLYGTIRKNWTGEYTGLPAISCSLFFIAVVSCPSTVTRPAMLHVWTVDNPGGPFADQLDPAFTARLARAR